MIWEKLLKFFFYYLVILCLIKLFSLLPWSNFAHDMETDVQLYSLFFNSLVAAATVCYVQYANPGPLSSQRPDTLVSKTLLIGLCAATLIVGGSFCLLTLTRQIGSFLYRPNLSTIMLGLGTCAAIGITEEFMIRGYFLKMLLKYYPKSRALNLSSLIFASLHIFNPHITLLAIFNLFIGGLILGQLYLSSQNLWLVIILHAIWDFLLGTVFGFPVGGIAFYSWILQGNIHNNIWSGGAFGFEGSILCFVSQLVILWFILKPLKGTTFRSALKSIQI